MFPRDQHTEALWSRGDQGCTWRCNLNLAVCKSLWCGTDFQGMKGSRRMTESQVRISRRGYQWRCSLNCSKVPELKGSWNKTETWAYVAGPESLKRAQEKLLGWGRQSRRDVSTMGGPPRTAAGVPWSQAGFRTSCEYRSWHSQKKGCPGPRVQKILEQQFSACGSQATAWATAESSCSISRGENPFHRVNPRCTTLLIYHTGGLRFCFDLTVTVPWLFLFEISMEVINF